MKFVHQTHPVLSADLIGNLFAEKDIENTNMYDFTFKEICPNTNPELLTLKFKKWETTNILEIYWNLPLELHDIFDLWIPSDLNNTIKKKGILIDAREISYNQYKLFLELIVHLSPHLKHVRFIVAIETSDIIDEITIIEGMPYFYRHRYPKASEDGNEKDRLDYYQKLHRESKQDIYFTSFLQKELLIFAEVFMGKKFWVEAKTYLDEAEKLGRKDIQLWNLKGQYYQSQNLPRKMLACYKRALQIDPMYYWVNKNLAEYFVSKKLYRKAIEHQTKAISCFPRSPNLYFERAFCYKNLGLEKEAQKDFKQVVKNTLPTNSSYLSYKAQHLQRTHYTDDAVIFYGAAFKKSMDYVNKKKKKGSLRLGGYDYLIDSAIETGVEALLQIATIEWRRGSWRKALRICNKILKIQYDFEQALLVKGSIFIQHKKLRKLEETVNSLKILECRDPNVYLLEGSLYIYKKEYEKAIEAYKEATRINTQFYPAYRGIGHALAWMRKDIEALAYFDKAIQIYPKDVWSISDMASSLNNLGKENEALEYAQKAIGLNPDYYHPYFVKACIYAKRGDARTSVPLIKKMLELDPAQKSRIFKETDFDRIRHTREFKKL